MRMLISIIQLMLPTIIIATTSKFNPVINGNTTRLPLERRKRCYTLTGYGNYYNSWCRQHSYGSYGCRYGGYTPQTNYYSNCYGVNSPCCNNYSPCSPYYNNQGLCQSTDIATVTTTPTPYIYIGPPSTFHPDVSTYIVPIYPEISTPRPYITVGPDTKRPTTQRPYITVGPYGTRPTTQRPYITVGPYGTRPTTRRPYITFGPDGIRPTTQRPYIKVGPGMSTTTRQPYITVGPNGILTTRQPYIKVGPNGIRTTTQRSYIKVGPGGIRTTTPNLEATFASLENLTSLNDNETDPIVNELVDFLKGNPESTSNLRKPPKKFRAKFNPSMQNDQNANDVNQGCKKMCGDAKKGFSCCDNNDGECPIPNRLTCNQTTHASSSFTNIFKSCQFDNQCGSGQKCCYNPCIDNYECTPLKLGIDFFSAWSLYQPSSNRKMRKTLKKQYNKLIKHQAIEMAVLLPISSSKNKRFMKRFLEPIVEDFKGRLSMMILPYGIKKNLAADRLIKDLGQMILCAGKHKKKQQGLIHFTGCLMDSINPNSIRYSGPLLWQYAKKCARKVGYKRKKLSTCINEGEGSRLLATATKTYQEYLAKLDTMSLMSPKIVLNKKLINSTEITSKKQIEENICSSFKDLNERHPKCH